jgi:hypothetical protein
MTGYQKHHFTQEENVKNVENAMMKDNKIFFLTKRLTGALDSYKEKRKVSMLASLRKFRTVFDTKRYIIDDNSSFLDTKPYLNKEMAFYGRSLMNILRQGIYSAKYSSGLFVSSSNSTLETLKYFLRFVYGYFNYNMNEEQLEQLIELIPKFKTSLILSILAQIKLEKGQTMNKILKFRYSSE